MKVSALHIYPVKGCGGVSVQRARVVERGFELDRRYMLVDEAGEFITQRQRRELALVSTALTERGFELRAPGRPRLPLPASYESGSRHDVTVWGHTGVGVLHESGSRWFSSYLGSRHCLVYMPEEHRRPVNPKHGKPGDIVSFADGYPFLVISEASLAELNRRLESPITMQRFRPNIVLEGAAPFAEDAFEHVRIGNLTFRGAKRCDRCVVTTIDPLTGQAGTEPLKTLATFRKEEGKVWFGMNLIHDGAGELAVGDEVELL